MDGAFFVMNTYKNILFCIHKTYIMYVKLIFIF